MDPSITKFIEEDEDETLHSGAPLEAFTGALNRDIEGGNSSSRPLASNGAIFSQGNSRTSKPFVQWQTTTNHGQNTISQSLQYSMDVLQKEQNSSEMTLEQHGPDAGNQYQKDSSQDANQPSQTEEDTFQGLEVQNSGKNPVHIREQNRTQNLESQHLNVQSVSTQQSISMAMSGQWLMLTGTSGLRPLTTGNSDQQIMTTGITSQKEAALCTNGQSMVNAPKTGMQVPFAILVPQIQAQLDKDRGMQLQTLYLKLRKNEISKEVFIKHMKSIVGDHMLKMAIYKFQSQAARNTETGPSKLPMQSQASAQQQQQTTSNVQISTDLNNLTMDSRERQADLQGAPESQVSSSGLSAIKQEKEHLPFPIQGLSKQQQQHLHFSQESFPTYINKGNNYHAYSATNSSSTSAPAKPQHQDLLMRPISARLSKGATQLGAGTQAMNMLNAPNMERNSLGEPRRTVIHVTSNSMTQQNSVQWQSSTNKEQRNILPSPMTNLKSEPVDDFPELQHKSQISSPSFSVKGGSTMGTSNDEPFDLQSSSVDFSTSASVGPSNFCSTPMPAQVDTSSLLNSCKPSVTSPNEPGNNGKTPLKSPSVSQKKPLETLGSLPPPSSKKQKASGAFLDQSIEQLNDVTAVSGVNLREEEEQLFSGPNEDGQVSEVSLRVVQEEEERLILQKIPLQKKLTEIMRKCGLKNRSSDVERCLSLCVEERMRALITTLIRFSKQRVDIEKSRQRTTLTLDVRKQIVVINERAQEEWEKKQAEIGKFQTTNESEDNTAADGDKEKDEGHVKSVKVNKGEEEKMRATAANVAARAALGGDDMLSKWQLMAGQARQKREGSGIGAASDSESGKDVAQRPPLSTLTRNTRDHQDAENGSSSTAINRPGTVRKIGRNQVVVPRIARSITIKDLIAVLEMEPQMSKSTLVYRLYERIPFDYSAE